MTEKTVWSSTPIQITSSIYGVRKCWKTQRKNYTTRAKRYVSMEKKLWRFFIYIFFLIVRKQCSETQKNKWINRCIITNFNNTQMVIDWVRICRTVQRGKSMVWIFIILSISSTFFYIVYYNVEIAISITSNCKYHFINRT